MKRTFLAAAAAIAAGAAPQSSAGAETTAPRPNVIVILADDLGYGDTSAYGSRIIRTPNIDAMAADGVRFTQGYVSHPVCAPSRAALLTGRYQTRFGYEFNPVGRDRTGGVSLDETFVGQVLQKAGYRTAMVGKWHLGESGAYHPVARGFDEYFGTTAGANAFIVTSQPGDEYHTPPGAEATYATAEGGAGLGAGGEAAQMVRLRARSPIYRGREPVEVKDYLTDAFTAEAVRFIGDNKDRPFFLYLAHTTPHTPLQAPAKYVDRYRHIQNKGQRVYAAMVAALDDSVGAIRAKLKAEGIEKNTLIVLLSDNGCAGYIGDACTNAPLNGYKGTHLEGGVRVPFIMAWPGRIKPGQVDPRVVSSLDIAPTAAALAGATLPKGSDGVDLTPFVTGKRTDTPNKTLYWRSGLNFAIRDGDWKMWMVNRADPGEQDTTSSRVTPDGVEAKLSPLGRFVMLYNLKDDPGERKNLAASRPDVVAQLQAKLEAWDKANVPAQWTSMRQGVRRIEGELVRIYP
ncbi:MAG: sulfatase-like hydrolase/transferase [Phenylobacterium sp.]|uniref:sulfatase-like hydrolase/transferase n=1 Tax=Phenylobacterium sp. TaxID=1871053 RepID=UPI001A537590|nr:sulfatase-like hydrolase/transferase [Phenylobacterium sp.]MBL8772062.1 sulfatase-like hydrolase/transferase [Phenylobacterium sp.]